MLKQLLLLLGVITFSHGAKYNCEIIVVRYNDRYSDNNSRMIGCAISVLNLKQPELIEPVADYPSEIIHLFLYGEVTILTGGFCETFPNLKYIDADKGSLEVIKDSAFHGCDKLQGLDIKKKGLKSIEKNSFTGLKKLKSLRVLHGDIPSFDVNLSDLTELKALSLSNLNITTFPADILREQKKLKKLYIYSNNLFDLDVESILKYIPNLEQIHLEDNNFKCSRLIEIIKFLKENNVKIGEPIPYQKKRDYTPQKIDGIHCLSDEQWNKEYSKHSNITHTQEISPPKLKQDQINQEIQKNMLNLNQTLI